MRIWDSTEENITHCSFAWGDLPFDSSLLSWLEAGFMSLLARNFVLENEGMLWHELVAVGEIEAATVSEQ